MLLTWNLAAWVLIFIKITYLRIIIIIIIIIILLLLFYFQLVKKLRPKTEDIYMITNKIQLSYN